MTITVKYFASLREEFGRAQDEISGATVKTVADVWKEVANGQPLKPNVLMAVNLEYVDANHIVNQGDEVAFFPPVTGG
ncbi:MAG: molybdopterin converting factor subunit 1 [Gammaproteobacteria bacterium]|nr:molybdopterin converting factor subunit 1 [Gammaproteobacteria bacterium]